MRRGTERHKRSAPACWGWRAGSKAQTGKPARTLTSYASPPPFVLAPDSRTRKEQKGGPAGPLCKVVVSARRQAATSVPRSGLCPSRNFRTGFHGFFCDRVFTPFAVGPRRGRVGCFYSGINVCRGTVERPPDATVSPERRRAAGSLATLRQVPIRKARNRREQARLWHHRRTSKRLHRRHLD